MRSNNRIRNALYMLFLTVLSSGGQVALKFSLKSLISETSQRLHVRTSVCPCRLSGGQSNKFQACARKSALGSQAPSRRRTAARSGRVGPRAVRVARLKPRLLRRRFLQRLDRLEAVELRTATPVIVGVGPSVTGGRQRRHSAAARRDRRMLRARADSRGARADVLARTLVAPAEMPIGPLTAAIGAPFLLWLLMRNGRGFGVRPPLGRRGLQAKSPRYALALACRRRRRLLTTALAT